MTNTLFALEKYEPNEKIDSLCDEFEQAIRSGESPSIDEFLERVDEADRGTLLYWLLSVQFGPEDRKSIGANEVDNLKSRFAALKEVIDDALGSKSADLEELPQIPGYTIIRLIRRGGQGAVFEATQERTGQQVAIKLVSSRELELIPDDYRAQAIDRLQQEIQTAAKMKHPNVVKIYDAGECESGFFFVMQLVEGGSLADRRSEISQVEAARLIRSIASAVESAHAQGVLHLDLKPHNVLYDDQSNQVLLTDFGLARLTREAAHAQAIVGTPAYMSPEQARGGEFDVRTDVFGLGATLYFLLTGRPPHEGKGLPYSASSDAEIRPRSKGTEINAHLDGICAKCMSADPQQRYQKCEELVKALDEFARAEDGHQMTHFTSRMIFTSPLFLIINLGVTIMLSLGWEKVPFLEPVVWIVMFSMYGIVYYVFSAPVSNDERDKVGVAMESLKAIWFSKMFAAMSVAASMRLVTGMLDTEGGPETLAILMSYPMFGALTGMVLATMAPRVWRKLYLAAGVWWIYSFVVMWTVAIETLWGPILYGLGSSISAFFFGLKLRQFSREIQAGKTPSLSEFAETIQIERDSSK